VRSEEWYKSNPSTPLIVVSAEGYSTGTAEPQNKEPQNVEVNTDVSYHEKLLRFEIPCSIFDIQKKR
jgi:hypothetical protein